MARTLSALVLISIVASPLAAQPATARAPQSAQTALDRYVAAPDSSFEWKAAADLPAGEGLTATLLDMTSQRWLSEKEVEGPLWRHWITVNRPTRITSDIAMLFNSGATEIGSPPYNSQRRPSSGHLESSA